MPSAEEIVEEMRRNPRNIRFAELARVCNHYFGKPRQRGSHVNYRVEGIGDPRVCIQSIGGRAKPYQVKQVLSALDEMKGGHHV